MWPEETMSGGMLCACATESFAIPLVGPFHRKWRQWPEVIVCACATGTFCITTRVVVQVHGYRRGGRVCAYPTGSCPRSSLVGPFHRNLATGSDVIFPRIFLSGSAKCWLGCSLRRPRLPLSLVICPFYLHNYIYSLFFSDMLCSTPRMVFLIKVKWMKCVIFS